MPPRIRDRRLFPALVGAAADVSPAVTRPVSALWSEAARLARAAPLALALQMHRARPDPLLIATS